MQCWCGDSDLTSADYSRHGSGNCNYECAGDADLACGGFDAFSLYNTENATEPSDPSYLGCFADERDNRVFTDKFSSNDMTPAVRVCQLDGFYSILQCSIRVVFVHVKG